MSGLNIIQTLNRNQTACCKPDIFFLCFVSETIISLPGVLYIQKQSSQRAVGSVCNLAMFIQDWLGVAEIK